MGGADLLALASLLGGQQQPNGLASILSMKRPKPAGLASATTAPDHPMFADAEPLGSLPQPDMTGLGGNSADEVGYNLSQRPPAGSPPQLDLSPAPVPKIGKPAPSFADVMHDPMLNFGLNLLGQRGWSTTPGGGFGANVAKAMTATGAQQDAYEDRKDSRSLAKLNMALKLAQAKREAAAARKPQLTTAKDGAVLATTTDDDGFSNTSTIYKASPEIQQLAQEAGLQPGTPDYQDFVQRSTLKETAPGYMADKDVFDAKHQGREHTNRLGEIGVQESHADARNATTVSEQHRHNLADENMPSVLQTENGPVLVNRRTGGSRPVADGQGAAVPSDTVIKQQRGATRVLPLLDQADALIDKSTSSYIGAGRDVAARVVGHSTAGATANAQLKVLEGSIMAQMPRMEGPQSDRDVQLYRQSAGQIGDPTVPAEQKKAALSTLKTIQQRYAGVGGATATGSANLDPLGLFK